MSETIILPQCLKFAVAGGHGVEKPLRQPQSAEPPAADGGNIESLPLRLQHFVEIVFQIERNERQVTRVFGKLAIDLMCRFAIALQNFAGVAMDTRNLGRDVGVLIQQLPGRTDSKRIP